MVRLVSALINKQSIVVDGANPLARPRLNTGHTSVKRKSQAEKVSLKVTALQKEGAENVEAGVGIAVKSKKPVEGATVFVTTLILNTQGTFDFSFFGGSPL
jgi:hypothetical protein